MPCHVWGGSVVGFHFVCRAVIKDHKRPSDRVRKKMENYAQIFDNIVWKKVTIMQKKTSDYAEISKINQAVQIGRASCRERV